MIKVTTPDFNKKLGHIFFFFICLTLLNISLLRVRNLLAVVTIHLWGFFCFLFLDPNSLRLHFSVQYVWCVVDRVWCMMGASRFQVSQNFSLSRQSIGLWGRWDVRKPSTETREGCFFLCIFLPESPSLVLLERGLVAPPSQEPWNKACFSFGIMAAFIFHAQASLVILAYSITLSQGS